MAVCYVIDKSIGHVDAEKAFRNLSAMTSKLDYSQEQMEAMLKEVAEAYEKDRGRGLIEAAFGET